MPYIHSGQGFANKFKPSCKVLMLVTISGSVLSAKFAGPYKNHNQLSPTKYVNVSMPYYYREMNKTTPVDYKTSVVSGSSALNVTSRHLGQIFRWLGEFKNSQVSKFCNAESFAISV